MAITTSDLKIYLKITDTSEDALLSLLLSRAENKVLNRRYPFGYSEEQQSLALSKYSDSVFDATLFYYVKQGGELQVSSSENGMGRAWVDEDSLYSAIVPVAKVRSATVTEDGEVS